MQARAVFEEIMIITTFICLFKCLYITFYSTKELNVFYIMNNVLSLTIRNCSFIRGHKKNIQTRKPKKKMPLLGHPPFYNNYMLSDILESIITYYGKNPEKKEEIFFLMIELFPYQLYSLSII